MDSFECTSQSQRGNRVGRFHANSAYPFQQNLKQKKRKKNSTGFVSFLRILLISSGSISHRRIALIVNKKCSRFFCGRTSISLKTEELKIKRSESHAMSLTCKSNRPSPPCAERALCKHEKKKKMIWKANCQHREWRANKLTFIQYLSIGNQHAAAAAVVPRTLKWMVTMLWMNGFAFVYLIDVSPK